MNFNMLDYTANFDPNDIQQNKGMSILAYFGPLVLIPILAAKGSRFARFHSNQGLLLFIVEIISGIVGNIPRIGWILGSILSIGTFVLFILGLVNAGQGQAKTLPLIGGFNLLK